MDRQRAAELAKQGFDLWQAEQLDAATRCYAEAVSLADPTHCATPSYHGEYAGVLASLGRDSEALGQFRIALALEEAQSHADSPGVIVARYFLAEHLLKLGVPGEALELTTSSQKVSAKQAALLLVVEALARAALGDSSGAKAAAKAAVSTSSAAQQARVRERLASILEEDA